MTGTASQVLWDVQEGAYVRLGFGALVDEAFKSLVLARIIVPEILLAEGLTETFAWLDQNSGFEDNPPHRSASGAKASRTRP